MIKIDNLSKSFHHQLVLEHVFLQIEPGSIYGLIGENGAGKSTLLQCIAGIYKPDEGSIRLAGKEIWNNEQLKARIAYVSDGTHLLESYTVKEMCQFFKTVYPDFSSQTFNDYNQMFAIPIHQKVSQLSKGMKTRLSLILHLSYHPDILILDEPTSGLDASIKQLVLKTIIDQAATYHTTVMIASHHLGEIEHLCDHLGMLKDRHLQDLGSVEQLKNQIYQLEVRFSQQPSKELLNSPCWLKTYQMGRLYYFITRADTSLPEHFLETEGAERIEKRMLSLEEIFIYMNPIDFPKKGGTKYEAL